MKKVLIITSLFIACMGFGSSAPAATLNITGIWEFSISGSWVDQGTAGGCYADQDHTSVATVMQTGSQVAVFADGMYFSGTLTGSNLTLTNSFKQGDGTVTNTLTLTLNSDTSGSGTLNWTWVYDYDYGYWCNGGSQLGMTKVTGDPNRNTTGMWQYSTSNTWSGCSEGAESPETGFTAVSQNGDTFTYIDQYGIHTGRVTGDHYLCTISYYEDGGITTQTIYFKMLSNQYAAGSVVWSWTDGYDQCSGGSDLSISKVTEDPTYDATGVWNLQSTGSWESISSCPDSPQSATVSLTQDGMEFRLAGYHGVQSGFSTGNIYTSFLSYPSNNGTTTEVVIFELSGSQNGSGFALRYWTDGSNDCYSGNNLTLDKTAILNSRPDTPSLVSPANGAGSVSLEAMLLTGPFSDPDEGDNHSKTEWQISKTSDFYQTILSKTSDTFLTTLKVPKNILDESTIYYWRARFYDKEATASQWSNVNSFTSEYLGKDTDNDGIPDNQEDDNLDMNNDGYKDHTQNFIKSCKVGTKGSIGVSRKNDTTVLDINAIESIDPNSISSIFRPSEMPMDMLVMDLSVAKPIDSCDVKLYFSQSVPEGARWLMYNSVHGWIDYTDQVSFSSNSATIKLMDYGYGDADGIANGNIVDPSGYCLTPIIKGSIKDSVTDQPIKQASITILGEVLPALLDGYFFSPIIPGAYTVKASANGYLSNSEHNVVIGQGDIKTLSFILQPLSNISLGDIISILQVLSGLDTSAAEINSDLDINEDKKLGLEDAIYVLQNMAGIR